ncbi:MAG: transposase [Gammaproteobacteria bacterium]|nr:transposase [Gammaproteobacteria bacterium]
MRHAYARSILKSLQQRFVALQRSELPAGALGKAAQYAVNHWPEIARYAKARFGHVCIDNNPIERGIRPTKLGLRAGCSSAIRPPAGVRRSSTRSPARASGSA